MRECLCERLWLQGLTCACAPAYMRVWPRCSRDSHWGLMNVYDYDTERLGDAMCEIAACPATFDAEAGDCEWMNDEEGLAANAAQCASACATLAHRLLCERQGCHVARASFLLGGAVVPWLPGTFVPTISVAFGAADHAALGARVPRSPLITLPSRLFAGSEQ